MIYIPNDDYDEPAMRFEGLAMYAFDCERLDDPYGCADAGIFDGNFIPDITEEGIEIMNNILDALISEFGHLSGNLKFLLDNAMRLE